MSKSILMVPNATGSGHNMRAFALANELRTINPFQEVNVLLGSMQDVFTPLFKNIGVEVVSTESSVVDHAKVGHLEKVLDREHFIDGYLVPTFLNGSKMLDYLSYYEKLEPEIVVSDYNLTASIAAIIGGYRHVLVTERYDFSLVQLSNDDFRAAGFAVKDQEINRIRPALTSIFDWLLRNSALVLTDKPPLADLDSGTALYSRSEESKVKFVGPMTRPTPKNVDYEQVRAELGLGAGPLFVACVGGTTMFMENKLKAIQVYREAFAKLREKHPDAEMVLIGRGTSAVNDEGVHTFDYLTDWMSLLACASALIAQPGWITVTEVAALGIPTIFVLGGRGEYHEVEALRRLKALGFPTAIEPTMAELYELLEGAANGKLSERCADALSTLAPTGSRATGTAAAMISELVS